LWIHNDRFSLAESQQAYEFMSQDSKKILKEKMTLVAPDYELDDICFPSFGRSYGFQGFLSGSDVVYALNALLQIAPEVATRLEHHIDWAEEYGVTGAVGNGASSNADAGAPAAAAAAADADNEASATASGVAVWTRSFFTAYDALSRYNSSFFYFFKCEGVPVPQL
jgi:cell division control protein 45